MDRKKKGKSKGAKLGAIVEAAVVEDNNQEKEEAVAEKREEKYCSPLYQDYLTKLMTNRGCQDEMNCRRSSVKEMVDKAEIESKSENTSNNVNSRASIKQLPEVEKNGSETAKAETETGTSNENRSGEKTGELKTSEERSNVELNNSGEKIEKSGEVAKKNEETSMIANDKNEKKEENPKSNEEKSKPNTKKNVDNVVEVGGEASNNGSPVNFRSSLRPPKGQRVIQ